MKHCLTFLGLLALAFASMPSEGPYADESTLTGTSVAPSAESLSPGFLSAFFGLDNSLPFVASLLCLGAWEGDGMPVVFSHTINPDTLQAEDFRVVSRAGTETTPVCVTLRPASDAGETRTVLLIGEFGNAVSDPPVRVRIVGDLMSDGAAGHTVNFRGSETAVTPLDDGPSLVWAEIVPRSIWLQSGRGSACPSESLQVVRVTWAGGVRLPNGEEPGDAERALYRITLRHPDDTREDVMPAALADLVDNDNNHYLCLNTRVPAVEVSFPSGHLVDPNGDLNPDS